MLISTKLTFCPQMFPYLLRLLIFFVVLGVHAFYCNMKLLLTTHHLHLTNDSLHQIYQRCSVIAFFCYYIILPSFCHRHGSSFIIVVTLYYFVKVWQLVLGVLIFSSLNLVLHWCPSYSCI